MEAWRRSDPGALPWLAHKPRQSWDHVSAISAGRLLRRLIDVTDDRPIGATNIDGEPD